MTYTMIVILFIVAYTIFAIIAGLGGFSKETVSSSRGYFIGGGVNYFVLFFTMAASWFSTWVYLGAVGSAYSNGIAFTASMTWMFLTVGVMGYWGPRIYKVGKKKQYVTTSDFICGHYNENKFLRVFLAVIMLIFSIPYLTGQTTGVGLILNTISNGAIPYWVGVLYTAVVAGIVVYFGGFKSGAWVNVMQGILFATVLWGAVIGMIWGGDIGGFDVMFQRLVETSNTFVYNMLPTGTWGVNTYLSFFILQGLAGGLAPWAFQRLYAAKNEKALVTMSRTLTFFYAFVLNFAACMCGWAGRLINPGLSSGEAENLLILTFAKISPVFNVVIMIGIMAAGMSTLSSILLSSSATIAMDLIKPFKPNMDDTKIRNWGRRLVFILLIFAIVTSLLRINSLLVLVNLACGGFVQIVPAMVGIFYWRRATTKGVISGLAASMVVIVLTHFVWPNPLNFTAGMWGLLANVIVFVLVSLATYKNSPARAMYRKDGLLQNKRTAEISGQTA